MGGTIENAKSSAGFFVDQMYLNDRVGVASYADTSRVDYPLTAISSSQVKDAAIAAISAIYASGNTSIGDGLIDGRDQLLTRGDPNHPWSIVLLSDGAQNVAPYVADVLPSIVSTKIKVFTIGLGSAVASLMQDIAYQTSGTYYYAPTDAQLVELYNHIAGQVAGRQTLFTVSSSVPEGQTQTSTIVVDSSVNEAIFSLAWNTTTSDLDLLRTPSGRTVDPQAAGAILRSSFVSGATYEYYKVNDPSPVMDRRCWSHHQHVFCGDRRQAVEASGEAFVLTAQGMTNLTANVAVDRQATR